MAHLGNLANGHEPMLPTPVALRKARLNMTRSAILGVGSYVPSKVVTNDDLAKIMNTSDEWIFQRSGIKERRYIEEDGIGASDLAIPASKAALEHAGVDKSEI